MRCGHLAEKRAGPNPLPSMFPLCSHLFIAGTSSIHVLKGGHVLPVTFRYQASRLRRCCTIVRRNLPKKRRQQKLYTSSTQAVHNYPYFRDSKSPNDKLEFQPTPWEQIANCSLTRAHFRNQYEVLTGKNGLYSHCSENMLVVFALWGLADRKTKSTTILGPRKKGTPQIKIAMGLDEASPHSFSNQLLGRAINRDRQGGRLRLSLRLPSFFMVLNGKPIQKPCTRV